MAELEEGEPTGPPQQGRGTLDRAVPPEASDSRAARLEGANGLRQEDVSVIRGDSSNLLL